MPGARMMVAKKKFNKQIKSSNVLPLNIRLGSLNLAGFWAQEDDLRTLKQNYVLKLFRARKLNVLCIQEAHVNEGDLRDLFRWSMRHDPCTCEERWEGKY